MSGSNSFSSEPARIRRSTAALESQPPGGAGLAEPPALEPDPEPPEHPPSASAKANASRHPTASFQVLPLFRIAIFRFRAGLRRNPTSTPRPTPAAAPD